MAIRIPAAAVANVFAIVIFGLVAAHSLVQVCWKTQACGPATRLINEFGYLFDLAKESNVPSWFSVVQLFAVAIALSLVAFAERARRMPTGA